MTYGFKAFNIDKTNRYGLVFEEGQLYTTSGTIKFGNRGNGFHMCKRLEDTLRYFDAMNNQVLIAKVLGFGQTLSYEDEYNGYYDMYAVEKIMIDKFLNRDEIIKYFYDKPPYRVCRFVSQFKLSKEEASDFKVLFQNEENVLDYIAYYQDGDKNVWRRKVFDNLH